MSIRLLTCILVVAFVQHTFAQTGPNLNKSSEITEQEKAEVRAFAKDLITGVLKTPGVRPFIETHFAKGFDTFLYSFLLVNDSDAAKFTKGLSKGERRRLAVAMLNYMAILYPAVIGYNYDMEKLPDPLRSSYERFESHVGADDSGDAMLNPKNRRVLIRESERLSRSFTSYLKKHPLETDPKYLEAVSKREKIDDYNYSIIVDSPDPNADKPAAKWIRKHSGARTYMVGTPYGLCIGVMRWKGEYKALYFMPWPMSYDGRLSK